MCELCKNGIDLKLGMQKIDLRSRVLSLDTSLNISINIMQNWTDDTCDEPHFADGASIQACLETGDFSLGGNHSFRSKRIQIKYCPFCGDRITAKDFI